MSKLEVDKIDPQSGTDLELGTSGDTITIPTGVTLDASNATTTLPATVVTTTGSQTLTNKSIDASQLTGTITPSDGTVSLAKLTATGTKDATTFLRGDNTFAGAGITNAQQFRLTADLTGNNSTQYITANIEEADNTGYAGIGSIVSQSSGVFSFSSTGLYQVIFTFAWNGQNTEDAVPLYIDFTNDNSTYNTIAAGYTHGHYEFTSSITTLVNIDDTTNDKIKFKTDGLKTSSYAFGDTSQTETGFTFIRLGDSQ
jgi:hypothetical protein